MCIRGGATPFRPFTRDSLEKPAACMSDFDDFKAQHRLDGVYTINDAMAEIVQQLSIVHSGRLCYDREMRALNQTVKFPWHGRAEAVGQGQPYTSFFVAHRQHGPADQSPGHVGHGVRKKTYVNPNPSTFAVNTKVLLSEPWA